MSQKTDTNAQESSAKKTYNPSEIEQKIYEICQNRGYFEVDGNEQIQESGKNGGKNFCLMMPPPNVTGVLHIGHALTFSLQDIITRYKRMDGYKVLYQPGLDHAGIATQNVVEKQLLAQGITKESIGRDAFIKKVWEWKEKSGGAILSQMKRLGVSAAWSRTRFTMDAGLQKAVKKAFVEWHRRGLIIQGNYMVNWCTHDGALSDIEVEYKENAGKLYYLRYYLADSAEQPNAVIASERDSAKAPTSRHCETSRSEVEPRSIHLSNPSESVIASERDSAKAPASRHCETSRSEVVAINSTTEGDALESRTDLTSGLPRSADCVCSARNDDATSPTRHDSARNDDVTSPTREATARNDDSKARHADSKNYIIVATTRPETYFGDTAVMVNPADERYKHLVGKFVELPLIGRKIPIIADAHVDMAFGTGAVKVTPAHDVNDYEVGKRHNLEQITIFDKDGILNEHAGDFQGLERLEAREKIVSALESAGFVEKIEPHNNQVGTCYRCGNIVEPYISKQWFVKKEVAQGAISRVNAGETAFHPASWKNNYNAWMRELRDWCISRQLWWGHRIPVWYCECGNVMASEVDEPLCSACGAKITTQDPDVLDTWFSSGLWAFSTLGWGQGDGTHQSSLRDFGEAKVEPRSINSVTEGDALESRTDSTSGLPRRDCVTARNDGVGDGVRECAHQSSLRDFGEAKVVAINSVTEGDALESRTDSTSGLPRSADCVCSARNDGVGDGVRECAHQSSLRATSEASGVAINSVTEGDALESRTDSTSGLPRSADCVTARNDGVGDGTRSARNDDSKAIHAHDSIRNNDSIDNSTRQFSPSDLKDFYPNSLLITGFDILFFWVARMLLSGESLLNKLPFKDIYLHALVRDEKGEKMSKSRGNVIDPLEVINSHGADALRFTLAILCAQGRDVRLSAEQLNISKNFANKLFNAANFLLLQNQNFKDMPTIKDFKTPLGIYMKSLLNTATAELRNALDSYRFNDGATILYRFLWQDFCDWGIELAKADKAAVAELGAVFKDALKLLHPYMPFISDDLWHKLDGTDLADSTSIMIAKFPNESERNEQILSDFTLIKDVIVSIRRAKAILDLGNAALQKVFVRLNRAVDSELLSVFVKKLARVENLEILESASPSGCVRDVSELCETYIPLHGIDLSAIINRLNAQKTKLEKEITKLDSMLNNKNFVANAPAAVLESNQKAREEAAAKYQKICDELKNLGQI